MVKLINLERMPLVLDDGTQLSAAGTPGSAKEVERISDADRTRLVETGRVRVGADEVRPEGKASPAAPPLTPEPPVLNEAKGGKGGSK